MMNFDVFSRTFLPAEGDFEHKESRMKSRGLVRNWNVCG